MASRPVRAIITGGQGAIGHIVANWLCNSTADSQICLLGRSGHGRLDSSLCSSFTEVVVQQCDPTSSEDAAALRSPATHILHAGAASPSSTGVYLGIYRLYDEQKLPVHFTSYLFRAVLLIVAYSHFHCHLPFASCLILTGLSIIPKTEDTTFSLCRWCSAGQVFGEADTSFTQVSCCSKNSWSIEPLQSCSCTACISLCAILLHCSSSRQCWTDQLLSCQCCHGCLGVSTTGACESCYSFEMLQSLSRELRRGYWRLLM